jgi:hypothetical protein
MGAVASPVARRNWVAAMAVLTRLLPWELTSQTPVRFCRSQKRA